MFRNVCMVAWAIVIVLYNSAFCADAKQGEWQGKVHPAPGRLAVISPWNSQTIFMDDDIKVIVGQYVKKGDVLLITKETVGIRRSRELEVQQAEAELELARVICLYEEKALKRVNELCPKKAIAENIQESCEGSFERARQNIVTASRRLEVVKQALVLATTPVKAPINGTVISLNAKPGDNAGPGRERLIWGEILDTSVVDVLFRVTDREIKDNGLKVGKPLCINGCVASGRIAVIFGQIMDDKNEIEILVRVDNLKGVLRINEKVKVSVSGLVEK